MNAASTVVSAVAGRSERLKHKVYEATGLGEVFNDSNVHLSVKSSPEKTAAALSLLAEREGLITKLNDSGSWRRRRALLVPHTFLYYFGEHTAETDLRPHGVIDLELYTDIQVVDGNLLKLAPGDETSPIRTFYLRLKDGDEAKEWAQAIRETRFGLVRDERDALRCAKMGLSDQLVTHEEAIHESLALLRSSRGRESAAVSELSRRDAEEARRVEQVRALLAASTSSPPASCDGGDIADNLADPPGWARSGKERPRSSSSSSCTGGGDSESSCLRGCVSWSSLQERARAEASAVVGGMGTGVGGRGSSVAATSLSELAALEEVIAERAQEVASLKVANEALREKEALADDRRRRDVAEALRLRDQERERAEGEASLRSDLEAELQRLREELADSRAGREEARVNLGVVAAACREAEAKSRELQEHRRVLAREVKASRVEQRRLSAALSCATTAAAAAAATAAAAKAEASAANAAAAAASAAASSGSRGRSSSAASSAAEDLGEEVARRGEEEEGTGCAGGENGHGFERSSGDEALTLPPPEGHLGEEQGAAQAAMEMAAETPDGGGSVHSGGDGGSGRVAPGSPEATEETPTEETLSDSAMAQTAPVVWRPSSLDVAGVNSRRQGGGEESTGGSESGSTSPEEGSPVFPGTADACKGVGNGGVSGGSGEGGSGSRPDENGFDGGPPTVGEEGPYPRGDGRFAASRSPSPPAAGGGVGFGEKGDEELEEETCGDGGVEDEGDKKGEQGKEGARARSSPPPPPPSTRGGNNPLGTGVDSGGGGGGGGGDRSSSPAATAAATAEALAAAFGESSSLRLNQMVASLSAGLRETRKARRKPLLGHLDDDDEGDGCDGGGLNAGPPPASPDEDDDGGVTDGTGTDGGDSRHDPTATAATPTTRKNSGGGNGAWSAWSTVGGGGGGGSGGGGGGGGTGSNGSHHGPPPLLLASDEEGRRSCGVSSATAVSMTAAGGGSADDGGDERCGRDVSEVFVGAFSGESATKTSPGAVAAAAAAASEERGVVAPPHGPSSSAEVSSTSTVFVAAEGSASKKAAALLRNLGRPDGEGGEGMNAREGPQIEEDDESASSSLALTQRGKSGGGDIDEGGGGAAVSGSAGVVAVVGENTHGGARVGVGDGNVGEAAVAVALAAAERGGRLSAEAAEAARRWEAKLKGSFVTMASGVRWGMAPQRSNDVKFFKP